MPNLIHWLAMSSLESRRWFAPRVSRNGGGALAAIVPSDDPFSTLWAMVIRLLENCPNEFMSLVSAISLCTEVSRTDRRSRDNNSINENSCTDRRTRNNQSESNSESGLQENDVPRRMNRS